MTWIAPWALAAAGAAAVLVGLLHLLARDRPPRWLLPTARFVSPGTARATRRAPVPRDLPLLALRVLAILLAGAAFAGPVATPAGGSIVRVVLLDRSRHVADAAGAVALARARLGERDRLVLFDSAATVVPRGAEGAVLDSLTGADADAARSPADVNAAPRAPDLASLAGGADRASLSAALVAALRVSREAAAIADSVAVTVLSPLDGTLDAATIAIRREWPGRIELVALPATVAPPRRDTTLHVRGAAGDPLVAAARLLGAVPSSGNGAELAGGTLVVRGAASAADSAHARSGGTLVVWPQGDTAAALGDSVGGIVVGDLAVPFAAVRTAAAPTGEPLARWVDGVPAVTEVPLGDGCIRTAVVPLPVAGDLTLRPGFLRALRALVQPCGAAQPDPLAESVRAQLAGSGRLAHAAALRRDAARSPATPWLLGAALLLLLLEPLLRRTRMEPAA